jgi:hypothetical protein
MKMAKRMRTVHDSLDEIDIPMNAYYGAQTARAIANFPISGLRLPPAFTRSILNRHILNRGHRKSQSVPDGHPCHHMADETFLVPVVGQSDK